MNPTPDALWQFIAVLSLLMGMGASAVSIFNSRRSQRREVTFVREAASKEELLHLVKDIERLEKDLAKHRELSEASASARQDKLERRLEGLSSAVTDLYRRVGNGRAP